VIDHTRRRLPPSNLSRQSPPKEDWGTLALAIGTARQAPAPLTPTHGRAESGAVKKKRKKKANDQEQVK
jgi:hypothetical protein